jgi:signal transduction histidine kinase
MTNSTLAPLTEVDQILQLSADQARRELTVEIEATVTLRDESFGLLFVQDATAGVFVNGLEPPLEVKPGDQLAIRGVTAAGLLSPVIARATARLAGRTVRPPPRPLRIGGVISGSADGQWVEVEGIVHGAESFGDHLRLELVSGLNRCAVWIKDSGTSRKPSLIDARVRVRGVCGADYGRSRYLRGFQLYASSVDDIAIIETPPEEPFAGPVRSVADLYTYPGLRKAEHQVRVQGVVTMCWPGRLLFIQDDTGGLCLTTRQATTMGVGDLVEAMAFRTAGSFESGLQDGVVRKLGPGTTPPQISLSVTQALTATLNGRLVQVDGQLLWQHSAPEQMSLDLRVGDQLWTAFLHATNSQAALTMANGSRLRLTGVCQLNGANNEAKPRLWLRSPADLEVLAKPTRWTPEVTWLGTATFGFAAFWTGLSALWMRGRTRRQTEQFQRQIHNHLRQHTEERERIGQDLHDNIIQSIYAVGLGLEDCRRLARQSPQEAEARLVTAVSALNGVIRDVRQFIGGLEPKALNGHELKTALKSLALTTGESSSHFRIEVDPTATRNLTPQQATQLLNIAKEAMSNSLRHANAHQTVVTLCLAEGQVRLSVEDDGVGFDAQTQTLQGNGLRNMAARARELGASLNIVSTPGQGARIIVNLPP